MVPKNKDLTYWPETIVCWIDCLKALGTCRKQSPQISLPLKAFLLARRQKLRQWILMYENSELAFEDEYWTLTDWRFMCMRFYSIRSNSPHNGPLRPLCGWFFHIEGRQRGPNSRLTVLDIFCIFYANAAPARLEHTQFQFWGDAIPHQRVVGENSLLFCSGRESKLDFARLQIASLMKACHCQAPEWVSVINFIFCHREKCEILFALANPIWDWCTTRFQIWKGDSASAWMENSP